MNETLAAIEKIENSKASESKSNLKEIKNMLKIGTKVKFNDGVRSGTGWIVGYFAGMYTVGRELYDTVTILCDLNEVEEIKYQI